MDVKARSLHDWQVTVAEAKEIQCRLASQVSQVSEVRSPQLVAGIDISPPDEFGTAKGAVVILRLPDLSLVEMSIAEQKVNFPYIPGLLSFREVPLALAACEKLTSTPDFMIVDAQGIAHPRRLGLACHLGLILNVPTIGCAKSILCGEHGEVAPEPGGFAFLIDRDEIVGVALRTKKGAKPVYVSPGHKVDLEKAIHLVLSCCRGYRLPEPTRLAHLAAAGKLPDCVKAVNERLGLSFK